MGPGLGFTGPPSLGLQSWDRAPARAVRLPQDRTACHRLSRPPRDQRKLWAEAALSRLTPPQGDFQLSPRTAPKNAAGTQKRQVPASGHLGLKSLSHTLNPPSLRGRRAGVSAILHPGVSCIPNDASHCLRSGRLSGEAEGPHLGVAAGKEFIQFSGGWI